MKLTTGELWLDDDPNKPFTHKVAQAATAYTRKHGGAVPNLCHVHPADLDGHPQQVGPVAIVPLSTVLRHHFWIGRRPT